MCTRASNERLYVAGVLARSVCVCVAGSSNCLGEKWQRSGTERMGKVVGI